MCWFDALAAATTSSDAAILMEIRESNIAIRESNIAIRKEQRQLRDDMANDRILRLCAEFDCWHTNARTKEDCDEFKDSLISFYGCSDSVGVRCMVTNNVVERKFIRPAHIVKHSMPHLMEHYGLAEADVDNPKNGILMLIAIEEAFDHKDLCFLKDPINNDFHVKILNPKLMGRNLIRNHSVITTTFADIDNAVLHFPSGRLPYRRCMSMHSKLSYSRALKRNWISDTEAWTSYGSMSDVDENEHLPDPLKGLTWQAMYDVTHHK
jgi:hypothetical protein